MSVIFTEAHEAARRISEKITLIENSGIPAPDKWHSETLPGIIQDAIDKAAIRFVNGQRIKLTRNPDGSTALEYPVSATSL